MNTGLLFLSGLLIGFALGGGCVLLYVRREVAHIRRQIEGE